MVHCHSLLLPFPSPPPPSAAPTPSGGGVPSGEAGSRRSRRCPRPSLPLLYPVLVPSPLSGPHTGLPHDRDRCRRWQQRPGLAHAHSRRRRGPIGSPRVPSSGRGSGGGGGRRCAVVASHPQLRRVGRAAALPGGCGARARRAHEAHRRQAAPCAAHHGRGPRAGGAGAWRGAARRGCCLMGRGEGGPECSCSAVPCAVARAC